MSRWLDNFAYHTSISLWLFVLAGGMTLTIALVTVGYHAVKAAAADPVKSLRHE
jgi:putative ABC transport system permease protein